MGEGNQLPDPVACFDRDRTTSLNPSPARGERAIPLAWVKFLAHDPRAADAIYGRYPSSNFRIPRVGAGPRRPTVRYP